MTSEAPIILYGFAKIKDHPSPSGFCQKLETFLRYTSVKYVLKNSLPSRAPKGKLPYIYDDKKIVADSHFIIEYLVQKGTVPDLDAKLTANQKSDSRAFQAYMEELIYPCVLKERWLEEENYQKMRQENFSRVFWPLNWIMSSWYEVA